ncbi:hypothetical protein [Nocardia barduliensis]|uniref:hypothetical protein n=1 Tax=Nocardia barduliensis TaxID=2736643 RepID=UPI00157260B1|nr:hypothetical protein [Nocardia barduliensis]
MSTAEGGKEIALAIRIDTARHAQLTWIAELRGSNLKQECFKAVDGYIEAAKQDPELIAKAEASTRGSVAVNRPASSGWTKSGVQPPLTRPADSESRSHPLRYPTGHLLKLISREEMTMNER